MAISRERLLDITRSLIDIYSPSGKESQTITYLANLFDSYGIPSVYQMVTEGRYNLLVQPEISHRKVVFVGHVDTVPASNLEKYKAVRRENKIVGLGACDMKSACAAMAEAFISFKEKHDMLPPVSLAFVVGEEETGDGAIRLCEE